MKVYYFGTYYAVGCKIKRRGAISAFAKMEYIMSALNQAGYNVHVISSSYVIDNRWKFDKGGKMKINDQTILELSPGFGYKTLIGKYFSISLTVICFIFKLLKIKKKDTLIVYHGDWYSKYITFARYIKKFQLIVEVEEIYTHAFNRNIKGLMKETNFIKSAKKTILVNDLIGDLIGLNLNKSIVCYGPYRITNNDNDNVVLLDNNKINLVYAGSFSTTKGGVFNAIDAALFLPNKYILHILGYGSKNIEDSLVKKIEEINLISECKIIFHGQKRGDEYHAFMQSCDIGLNPQNMGDYMLYAYPSKTLAYLCFGLNVVTSPLPTLQSSKLNRYFNYFKSETPKDIANTIINAKLYTETELKEVVNILNDTFVQELKSLIEEI